jgi:hypothetical protein
MDGTRFDKLVRAGVTSTGRRRVLRSLGVGLLGSAGVATIERAEPSEAASGRCLGDCGQCGQCLPGKCKRKRGKKKCKAGVCLAKSNGAACGNNGSCQDGVCAEEPTCLQTGRACFGLGACCSGTCTYIDSKLSYCERGAAGTQCYIDDDCDSRACRNFRCQ